jgi:hypothetical protein
MKWIDYTEIVVGHVLRGKLDPHAVNPDDCYPPYGEVIPIMRDGGTREDVITKVGFSIVRDAIHASEGVNGEVTALGWLKLLEQSASKFKNGTDLKKVAEDLIAGKEVDLGKLLQYAASIDLGYRSLTPLSDVEPEKNAWIKTGYDPIDDNVGGLPMAGLVLIAASPGVGKTTLALKLITSLVRKYKRKKVAFFSLEMLMSQIVSRFLKMDETLTKEEYARILATEDAYSIGEIYATASRVAATEKLSAIVIDFADLMVEGEQSEAVMGQIYRSLSVLAKRLRLPVILICQLNRATYSGGVPKINHVRYSGMAEAMASLIFLLYNPNTILADYSSGQRGRDGENRGPQLPAVEGRGYILVGKSRFGFLKGGPGAISVEWDGAAGWGETTYGYTYLTGV